MEPRWEYFKGRIIFKLKAGIDIWKAVEETCTEFNNWRPAAITAGLVDKKDPSIRILGYEVRTNEDSDTIVWIQYTGGITRDIKNYSLYLTASEMTTRLDNASRWSKIEIE